MSSKPGFWRQCRIAFRCARFAVWTAALLAAAALGWFNVVGLPGFLKTRLITALHERGVQLEFSRLRWRFFHGLICDNVRIGAAGESAGPVLTAREVQLRLDYPALVFHQRVSVNGLVLRQGDFVFPLSATNALALTNLQSELRFEADDVWSLDQFRAGFAGATLTLGGRIAHAPEFKNWKMFSAAGNTDRGSVESSLKNFSDVLEQIHFDGKPELNVRVSGDARDVHSITLAVNARVPGVRTPWFSAQNLQFAARLLAPVNAPDNPEAAWGFWTNLQPFHIEWTARGTDLMVAGLEVEALDCNAVWNAPQLAVPHFTARLGGGGLDGSARLDVGTRGMDCKLHSDFDMRALAPVLTEEARRQLSEVTWSKPPAVNVAAGLVLPAWTNRAPDWRGEVAPSVWLDGELALTNTSIMGGATWDSVRSHFSYRNRVWSLPDLAVAQGRTALDLSAEENDATRDFHCVLSGKLDPDSILSFLTDTNAVQACKCLDFRQPIALVLGVTGNLRDWASLSATGRMAATEFAIRGQWVDSLTARLAYTNRTAEFFEPKLVRAGGAEQFVAEKATLDISGQKLFLHHGSGHVSPSAVVKAIGPKTAEVMEPYKFLSIPTATVEGCIPLKFAHGDLVPDEADLTFDVVGTLPFRWRRFETPQITGTIHWRSRYLILTNVTAETYGGTAHGWGVFDLLTPGDGTDFSFFVEGTNADFNAMGRALWSPTNQLKGALSGALMITYANSSDWRSWNGYGHAELRDGLLWNAPIFGLMSLVLDTLTPGLDVGNSRATDGAGHFTMTNGVIYTDSLEIRSLTMRMNYVGTVDLQENLAARVKAQLLRNTPVMGSVFSLVLSPVSKAFECGVTGTLDQPRITPVYIPFSRVLTAPLHPIRTMEGLFANPATNNPPKP